MDKFLKSITFIVVYTIVMLLVSLTTMIIINFVCYIIGVAPITFLDSLLISSGFLIIKLLEKIIFNEL